MKKFINFVKEKKYQFLFALFLVITPITSSFAEGGGAVDTTTLTNTLKSVASNITGVIADVAPIAIGVTAVFLVWKYGVKFFKGLLG